MIRALTVVFLCLPSLLQAAELDAALARIMRGRVGTTVVVEVESGKVLGAYRMDIATRTLARPGSAFKPFTLMAMLESGKLKPEETLVCRRNLHVGRHNLWCTHPQTGPLNAVSALAYSCNDFFATMGSRLSAEELRQAFVRAGLESPSGFAKGEAVGSMQLARTDEERKLQAIGEGEMRVTPLEMLAAYRKLALRRLKKASGAGEAVYAGLEAGTEYGMARLGSAKSVRVAGKTGTARTDRGPWTNAWFAGYAPTDQPKIAVVVFLEKGTGPGDAAPLASEIFEAWAAK